MSETQAVAPGMRFYWQPGCSSCVRVKEMLTEMGVDFTSVNILEVPGAVDELAARGVRSVPVLTRGEEMIFTQSLDDVATFVGRERHARKLPPQELLDRWTYFRKRCSEALADVQVAAGAQCQGMSSSMRAWGQLLTRRSSRSVK